MILVAGGEGGGTIEAPLADAAGIDVDKVGMGIVADASAGEGKGRAPESEGIDAGHAEVNGFRLDVKAVFGDAGGVFAKRRIGGRAAIAANDVDFAAGMADGGGEVREDVVEARIEVANVVGDVVAQEVIEPGQGCGDVLRAAAVNDADALAGVGVVEQQGMILGFVCR